jgi:flavocytochrome c
MAWDESVDVVVVGSGFAGLAAAIESAGSGAAVLLLEKMSAVGGNSAISDGGIAVPGNAFQARAGIQDSPDLMVADMLRAGQGLNHPALVKAVAEGALECFEWTRDYLGVEYLDRLDIFGGHSVARCLTAAGKTGATIIHGLLDKARRLDVRISLRSCLQRLVLEPEGRNVRGVEIRDGYDYLNPSAGRDRRIEARGGVVLATGGFGADLGFRILQDPRLGPEIDTTNKPFATAEALREAIRIGAVPVQLSHIQLGPWASPDEKGYGEAPGFADYIVFQYGMLVDPASGRRFVDELADRKAISDRILALGHPAVGLVDSRAVESSGWGIGRPLAKGVVRSYDSLSDFAAAYGLPTEDFRASVQRFNSSFDGGGDWDFGKRLLPGAGPLEVPPFYGVRLWPKVHYTMGGLGIDGGAAVLDLEGRPIGGLFAAGEVTGGVHGACRLGSCSITECLVIGRIAGRKAAPGRAAVPG